MLSVSSNRTFGTSTLKTTAFLEREFRAHLVERHELLFDSAFCPPVRKESPVAHLYFHLEGMIQVLGGQPQKSPIAYLLAEREFDRTEPGVLTFRSWGAPGTILDLRVPLVSLKAPVGLANGPLDLPASAWDALYKFREVRDAANLANVMLELSLANVLTRNLSESVVADEPDRFQRLWGTLAPLYQDLATSATAKQIAVLTKLSLRQLGRDLGDFTRTFRLFGGGFRDTMRVLRLRAAVLVLSAPGISPRDVAKHVGYGSLDAMGRAFRDATLPAPSEVQAAVRFPTVT